MLQTKSYICFKMLSNCIGIKKTLFKNQKPRALYLIALKSKVTKVLLVKCAPVNSMAKGIVLAHNNRYLLARHGDHHWTR